MFPPPPIQGIGNAGGFTMQVELRDGSFDLAKLQTHDQRGGEARRRSQSGLQRVTSSFRSTVPQMKVEVDRAKAETLQVSIDDVFSTLAAYLGSSYVDQFNKFGRVVPGLCAGGFAVPPAARGHRAAARPQQAGAT